MRRKEKSVQDRKLIDNIIHASDVCHLSCCMDEQPYLIPISFGYDGAAIYIHTAPEGKKISIFEQNPRVCLSFVSYAKLQTNDEQPCNWSFSFSSVIAEGEIKEISSSKGKTKALNHIMTHYSGRSWGIPEKAISGTRVWKIILEHIGCKISPPSE